jgi:hypothetical protein
MLLRHFLGLSPSLSNVIEVGVRTELGATAKTGLLAKIGRLIK